MLSSQTRLLTSIATAIVLCVSPLSASAAGICNANKNFSQAPYTNANSGATSMNSVTGQLGAGAVTAAVQKYKTARDACQRANENAQAACLEGCSKEMQQGLQAAGQAANMISLIAGAMNQTCGSFGDALKGMQAGFAGYSAACAAAKKICDTSCADAAKAAKEVDAAAGKVQCSPGTEGVCKPAIDGLKSSIQSATSQDTGKSGDVVGSKQSQCGADFSKALMDAATTLAALAASMMAAKKQCDESQDTPTTEPVVAMDCNLAENQQKQECICIKNPRLSGCPNGLAQSAGDGTLGGMGGTDVNVKDPEAGATPVIPEDARAMPPVNPSAGGGGAPMLGGGGGGMGSSGAGFSKGDKESDGKGGSGLKADIFGGSEGGGGAGAAGWGSFGGKTDAKKGGNRGPAKATGMTAAGAAGLTGAGGRSNWEKVAERYRANKPTLLNAEQ